MSSAKGTAIDIANLINKGFKNRQVAFVPGNDELIPTDVMGWVSTGSTLLDLAISNHLLEPLRGQRLVSPPGRGGCTPPSQHVQKQGPGL